MTTDLPLPDRLQQAFNDLVNRGITPSVRMLIKEAKCSARDASKFLKDQQSDLRESIVILPTAEFLTTPETQQELRSLIDLSDLELPIVTNPEGDITMSKDKTIAESHEAVLAAKKDGTDLTTAARKTRRRKGSIADRFQPVLDAIEALAEAESKGEKVGPFLTALDRAYADSKAEVEDLRRLAALL